MVLLMTPIVQILAAVVAERASEPREVAR
jgi:hypothetical protein